MTLHSSELLHQWSAILGVAALAIAGEVLIASAMRDLGDLDRYRTGPGLMGFLGPVRRSHWLLEGRARADETVDHVRVFAPARRGQLHLPIATMAELLQERASVQSSLRQVSDSAGEVSLRIGSNTHANFAERFSCPPGAEPGFQPALQVRQSKGG